MLREFGSHDEKAVWDEYMQASKHILQAETIQADDVRAHMGEILNFYARQNAVIRSRPAVRSMIMNLSGAIFNWDDDRYLAFESLAEVAVNSVKTAYMFHAYASARCMDTLIMEPLYLGIDHDELVGKLSDLHEQLSQTETTTRQEQLFNQVKLKGITYNAAKFIPGFAEANTMLRENSLTFFWLNYLESKTNFLHGY